jgi:hypothetical protein
MDPASAASSATGVGTQAVATSSATASGGFQYTPPSYLLRASDTTNRPWNYGANNDEGEFYGSGGGGGGGNRNNGENSGENEYDLPQEQRPQTRRESNVDAHFHQRVRTKQSRYRDIISGSDETTETTECSSGQENDDDDDDDDDSVLLAAANVDSTLLIAAKENAANNNSFARVRSEKLHMSQASQNNKARINRKERITGHTKPNPIKLRSASEPVDAETVRSLRAHRLRSSLLKQTPDEFDIQTKLELRRLQSRKDDEQQENERASLAASDEFSVQQQKSELENERKAIEKERKALAIAKEEASYALKRSSQINDERRGQRELDAIIEMNRLEDEKITRRREEQQRNRSSSNSRRSKKNNNNRSMKTKTFNNEGSGDDDMTIFDLDNDFAFLNDLSGIVRDSGLMRGCLSVTTGCFGNACNDETILKDTIIIENNDNDNNVTATKSKSKSSTESKSTVTMFSKPALVPCSDTSHSDIEGDDNDNGNVDNGNKNVTNKNDHSLRHSRLYAKYRV